MSDIIERLKFLIPMLSPTQVADVEEAIKEIEFLRLHAGAVTRGESFDDIAKRVGRQPKDEAS